MGHISLLNNIKEKKSKAMDVPLLLSFVKYAGILFNTSLKWINCNNWHIYINKGVDLCGLSLPKGMQHLGLDNSLFQIIIMKK